MARAARAFVVLCGLSAPRIAAQTPAPTAAPTDPAPSPEPSAVATAEPSRVRRADFRRQGRGDAVAARWTFGRDLAAQVRSFVPSVVRAVALSGADHEDADRQRRADGLPAVARADDAPAYAAALAFAAAHVRTHAPAHVLAAADDGLRAVGAADGDVRPDVRAAGAEFTDKAGGRRGCDVRWRRVAATPRPRRSVER